MKNMNERIENICLSPDEQLERINEKLVLIQRKNGLKFGTDAYLLAAFTKKASGPAADLGSGTGVASLLCLSKERFEKMYAVELQPEYAGIIERNSELNGFNGRLITIPSDVRELRNSDIGGECSAVITNPPYMKADGGFHNISDEKNIARREMHGRISDFCMAASRILKWGGAFYAVYRPDRLCELLFSMRESGIEPKRMITVYPDTDSRPCLILCEGKKGASEGMVHSRPLIIYKDGSRSYTDDMQTVYDDFTLEHLFQ